MLASNIEVLDCDERLFPDTFMVTVLLLVNDVLLSHSWLLLLVLDFEDLDPVPSPEFFDPPRFWPVGRTLAVFLRRKRCPFPVIFATDLGVPG